ncbi:hypothetical protein IMZ48_43500 [Candidatus Bathyarchaeota archaeon]|nr:hypothetical protein [Candidatus Bathyarchaeota archaeon]
MTLDVTPGPTPKVLQAAVDFGMIEGTMIFALSDEALDVIDNTPPDDQLEGYSSSEKNKEEDEDNEPNPSGKRSASPKTKPGDSKKQKADVPPRRVYLRIRGRETGEGQPFSSERGYIDFTDDTYTQFKGVVDLPYMSDRQAFEGYKVDSRPRRKTKSWGKFDEGWWEEEEDEEED